MMSHLFPAPLLDSSHLELCDGVVGRVEPLVEFLQDGQGGEEGGVPGVDQLGATVGGGDHLPRLHPGAALPAGPVPPLLAHHCPGAVSPGAPEIAGVGKRVERKGEMWP